MPSIIRLRRSHVLAAGTLFVALAGSYAGLLDGWSRRAGIAEPSVVVREVLTFLPRTESDPFPSGDTTPAVSLSSTTRVRASGRWLATATEDDHSRDHSPTSSLTETERSSSEPDSGTGAPSPPPGSGGSNTPPSSTPSETTSPPPPTIPEPTIPPITISDVLPEDVPPSPTT